MLKAAGPVWHKSDIKKNRLPISGIDTDAKWGFSKSKGWVFGYKLHMSCSVGKFIVPLSACTSTANVDDSQKFQELKSHYQDYSKIFWQILHTMMDYYDSCTKKKIRLICSIKTYPSTPPDRIKLAEFYNSVIGQELYSQRKVSIEPLFEYLKDIFDIRVLPVKGSDNVKSFVLICVLVYPLTVYYNGVVGAENPRIVKRMLCC